MCLEKSDEKPRLVIHAGLPKCATSSLQNLFYRDDHRVCRELDLVWIGRGLTAWSTGVAVSEIMYDKEAAMNRIRGMILDPDCTYFLSTEALSGNTDVLELLSERFEISHVVLSVRLPILMAMSAYCFSGWLTQAPEEVDFRARHAQIVRARDRIAQFAPVVMCPIEPAQLATRFCEAVAGAAPTNIENTFSQASRVNSSAPPAVAIAMHKVLQQEGIHEIPGPARATFTRVAKNNPGRPQFKQIMPEPFASVFRDEEFCDRQIALYSKLLQEGDVAQPVIDEAIADCVDRLEEMRQMPSEIPELSPVLEYRARWNLARVQEVEPDALPLGVADLRHYLIPLEKALLLNKSGGLLSS